MTRSRAVGVAVAFVLALPATLQGQAICSAPHSTPTFARSGAMGTLPSGAGWLQLSLYAQRATEGFDPLGTRQSFIGGSEFDTRSAYVTGAFGIVEGVEAWAQLPAHRLTVTGSGGRAEGNGVGDVRAAVRVSPRLIGSDLPVAVRVGLKLPGADFPVDARVLPLTEGQRDLEVSLESGWSGVDGRVYLAGWVGHRWRGENRAIRFQPGDESFAHAALGARAGWLWLELGVDGLWGRAPNEQGLTLAGSSRRLLQLIPTAGAAVGPGQLEVTALVPVAGRNLPAGVGLSAGYRLVWGM